MYDEIRKIDNDLIWEVIRRRMIAQTGDFITQGLMHPELAIVIPTIPVGSGTFSPRLAETFWRGVLGEL